MDKKPSDKEIKKAIDRQMKMLESVGMLRVGKKRNQTKDAPITLTADKIIEAKHRYLGEKNLHEWKISRFLIPNWTPFEYDYKKDGILSSDLYKEMEQKEAAQHG